MDIGEYRDQLQRELQRETEQQTEYKDFLDRRRSVRQRLNAFSGAPGAGDASERQQTVELVRDRDEDTQLRIAALDALGSGIGQGQESLDLLLDLLLDGGDPAELRRAALAGLRQASFSSPVFAAIRPEYLAALRTVIDDDDRELREAALEVLAEEHDEYAQRRLLQGLQNRKQALVPAAKAIQLLGYDIHAEHFPILRQIVRRPPSQVAQREAIRLLATDASSTDLLTEILGDKSQKSETRRTSAVALQALAPAEWEQLAERIVLDDEEDELLQALCISALAHFPSARRSADNSRLRGRVERLQQQSGSRQLRHAAGRYLELGGAE